MRCWLIFSIAIFCFYYSNCYVCSVALFNKEKNFTLTIGVCHRLETFINNNIFDLFLNKLNKLNKKITFIIEGNSESYLSNCLFIDLEKSKSLYQSINFIAKDSRSLNLRLFLKCYKAWAKAKYFIDTINLIESNNYNFFPDLSKSLNFEQAIIEIEDNIKKINLEIKQKNFLNTNIFINNLRSKIENCFDEFKKNLFNFKNFINTNKILEFIETIELDLADLSFILEILKLEKDNLIIVIITGNDHTININNFLNSINYKLAIPLVGISNYIINNIYPAYLNQNDLEKKINEICEFLLRSDK